MKKYLLICVLLSSCGTQGFVTYTEPCSVTNGLISCPDGTSHQIKDGVDGKDGVTGVAGSNGSNGHSVVFSTLLSSPVQCTNGGSVILMALDTNDNNVFDNSDSNIQSTIICNGTKGDQGIAGQNGNDGAQGVSGNNGHDAPPTQFTTVQVLEPCGHNSSPYKEVLLRLTDGSILASFSELASGYNTRLTLLSDGTFSDTDSSGCVFTVSTSGHTRTISWSGYSESWSVQ